MVLSEYNYVFAIGTFFAMLDAYNNGANDVANAWATSVSSRSISYRWAMVLATVFEMTGAIAVGARTADTIKNGKEGRNTGCRASKTMADLHPQESFPQALSRATQVFRCSLSPVL